MAEIEIPNLASTGGHVDVNTLTSVLTEIVDAVNNTAPAVDDGESIDGGSA